MKKCKECGYYNDIDASFCEKCGTNLKYTPQAISNKKGMGQLTKILIVLSLVLIAALGITLGAMMQMNKPALSTANNTTIIVNNASNNNQQNSTKKTPELISSNQAADIALKSAHKYYPDAKWSVGSVDFVPAANYKNTPNYMVELSNNDPTTWNYTGTSMDFRVNAQTGAIMD